MATASLLASLLSDGHTRAVVKTVDRLRLVLVLVLYLVVYG